MASAKRKLLLVVMDGVGHSEQVFGNAVLAAKTPNLDFLSNKFGRGLLHAHGKYVGLPSNKDMGNSEVGHNALGGGRVVDQGAKLVQMALDNGSLFKGESWNKLLRSIKSDNGTLHLLGLLSDGNVHSHENHLHALIKQATKDGIKRIRVHVLLDGRDVPEKSAEVYAQRLEACIATSKQAGVDIRIASGGGRMVTTMDRYEADWTVVKRGWDAHVRGVAEYTFSSLAEAISHFRTQPGLNDQNIPAFVIGDSSQPEKIENGDGVVFFNFRGDRAVQISRAFTEKSFAEFDREYFPEVFYAGMMQYDGDLEVPKNFLVAPPVIDHCLSEVLIEHGVRQFACSETQKFGHVTFFWNGNRSGYIDEKVELYQEIPSALGGFEKSPEMKAAEISNATIAAIQADQFDFGRINYANGDMVGHTGDFWATVKAVEFVDQEVGRLWAACEKAGVTLVVTADHGNADDMFQDKFDPQNQTHSSWVAEGYKQGTQKPKTSHSLSKVPFLWCDPRATTKKEALPKDAGIGQVAPTVLEYFGAKVPDFYARPIR